MKAVGLFYGSSSGKTEKIANMMNIALSRYVQVEMFDIAEVLQLNLRDYPLLVFGVPTWGIGRLQDDWLRFISNNPPAKLSGNCIAFFGLGDQDGYPSSFNDGMGLLYELYRPSGFLHVGKWPVEGYNFESSKAVEEGMFIGLALDEENEADRTRERIDLWVNQILTESKKFMHL